MRSVVRNCFLAAVLLASLAAAACESKRRVEVSAQGYALDGVRYSRIQDLDSSSLSQASVIIEVCSDAAPLQLSEAVARVVAAGPKKLVVLYPKEWASGSPQATDMFLVLNAGGQTGWSSC